jgi:hypothetical protein
MSQTLTLSTEPLCECGNPDSIFYFCARHNDTCEHCNDCKKHIYTERKKK